MTDPWEQRARDFAPADRLVVLHFGQPVPQGRPRASIGYRKGGKPVPILRKADASEVYETGLAETARDAAARSGWVAPAADVRLGLWIDVYRAQDRGDLDNFVKAASDAFTVAGIWRDDRRVVQISARMFIDRQRPRLLAVVRRVRVEG